MNAGTGDLRVLHVVTLVDDSGAYGGPTTVAVNQLRALTTHDVAGTLVSTFCGSEMPGLDVPSQLFRCHQLPGTSFSGIWSARMVGWIRSHRHEFDVAHIHLARDLVPLAAIKALGGMPYVTQSHGMVAPPDGAAKQVVDLLATRPALRGARANLALQAIEAALLVEVGAHPAAIRILGNGVPTDGLGAWQRPGGRPLVAFIARLHPRKRPRAFIEMASRLLSDGVDADFVLAGPDGGELQGCLEMIASRRLQDAIHYVGALKHVEVNELLLRSSVFVLPSIEEPYPMGLLEALAVGVPSVATTDLHMADELEDVDHVFVADPEPAFLARATRAALSMTDTAVLTHGRDLARRRWSMGAIAAQLSDIYLEASR